MTNNIDIRETNSADIPLLVRLIRDSYHDVAQRFGLTPENCPKHPSNCTDKWIEKDFDRGVTYYILESNNAPVGCIALEKTSSDVCYLERLAVLPEYRRNGFGKLLVDHVICQAKASGVKEISIGIIAEDIELKQWYQKIGFIKRDTKGFSHLPFMVTFMICKL
jgi:ribosomal protein S18 acetylase RimI-like enzyme